MKKSSALVLLVFCFCVAAAGIAWAAVSGADLPKCSEPLLITNAGQGPGGKMGRLLMSRSGVVKELTYNAEPQPEDLEKGAFKTMVVVIGSSAKGLGASGITIDQEIERLDKMMKKAKEMGIQIIAAHIEGKARRGKSGSADERSIDAILPYASHIIVMKEADDVDQKFTNFGREHNIPVTYLDAALDLVDATKVMYAQ